MGNSQFTQARISGNDTTTNCVLPPFAKFYKYKLKKSRKVNRNRRKLNKNKQRTDEFIIQYHQSHKFQHPMINIDSLDKRRFVFISLIGLYQTYQNIPSFILYSSLFILPLKRDWIYEPHLYRAEIEASFLSQLSLFNRERETKSFQDFIQLLQWKDKQGLIFWMLDDYTCPSATHHSLIAPFWQHLSLKLSELKDPLSASNYNAIPFDAKWWQTNYNGQCKQASILSELYFVQMKFQTIAEILNSTNGTSLNVVTHYDSEIMSSSDAKENNQKTNQSESKPVRVYDDQEGEDTDNEEDDWWVSPDYDPYDLDDNHIDLDTLDIIDDIIDYHQ